MKKRILTALNRVLAYVGAYALLFALTTLFLMLGWDIIAVSLHTPLLSYWGACGPTILLLLLLVLCRVFFKDINR